MQRGAATQRSFATRDAVESLRGVGLRELQQAVQPGRHPLAGAARGLENLEPGPHLLEVVQGLLAVEPGRFGEVDLGDQRRHPPH